MLVSDAQARSDLICGLPEAEVDVRVDCEGAHFSGYTQTAMDFAYTMSDGQSGTEQVEGNFSFTKSWNPEIDGLYGPFDLSASAAMVFESQELATASDEVEGLTCGLPETALNMSVDCQGTHFVGYAQAPMTLEYTTSDGQSGSIQVSGSFAIDVPWDPAIDGQYGPFDLSATGKLMFEDQELASESTSAEQLTCGEARAELVVDLNCAEATYTGFAEVESTVFYNQSANYGNQESFKVVGPGAFQFSVKWVPKIDGMDGTHSVAVEAEMTVGGRSVQVSDEDSLICSVNHPPYTKIQVRLNGGGKWSDGVREYIGDGCVSADNSCPTDAEVVASRGGNRGRFNMDDGHGDRQLTLDYIQVHWAESVCTVWDNGGCAVWTHEAIGAERFDQKDVYWDDVMQMNDIPGDTTNLIQAGHHRTICGPAYSPQTEYGNKADWSFYVEPGGQCHHAEDIAASDPPSNMVDFRRGMDRSEALRHKGAEMGFFILPDWVRNYNIRLDQDCLWMNDEGLCPTAESLVLAMSGERFSWSPVTEPFFLYRKADGTVVDLRPEGSIERFWQLLPWPYAPTTAKQFGDVVYGDQQTQQIQQFKQFMDDLREVCATKRAELEVEGSGETVDAEVAGGTIVHTVVRGDTVWALAQAHGTSVQAIAEANNLSNPGLIRVGQQLVIPVTGS